MGGRNENTDGLVRQYLPKGSSLRGFSGADLAAVEDKLNKRPRKRLTLTTPAQVFAGAG